MNDFEKPPLREAPAHEVAPPDHDAGGRPPARREAGGGARRWALGLAVIAVLVAGLGVWVLRHFPQNPPARAPPPHPPDFVPPLPLQAVRARHPPSAVPPPPPTNPPD